MTTSNSANTKQSNNASQKRKPIHNGYFNHPTSSSSNIPMSILIREQGLEIYGLYWVMLEEAHAQLKCCVNIQTMGIIANIFHAQPEHLELLYHHYFRRPGKGYNSHILYADFCEESAIRSYFPHPLLAYTDNELLRMIMQDGLKAYGLYWLVMEKLYQQPQHFLAPQTASFIQNLYDVSDELMESVLYNYGLFYLDEKMNLHSKAIDDYREALDNMEDEKFLCFLKDSFENIKHFLKPGGVYYIWHADSKRLLFSKALRKSAMEERQNLVWVKNCLVLGRQDYQWKHEPCLYGWKEGAAHYFIDEFTNTTVYDDAPNLARMSKEELKDYAKTLLSVIEDRTTILREDKPSSSRLHPTMKPVPLIAKQIKNSSRKGEIVLDIFGGSGTTLIACEQTGRKARLVEVDPVYCDVIVKRWEEFTGEKAVKING